MKDVTVYKLQPGSPAINTGRLVSGNGGQDFWGNTVPNGVTDRGAHEVP
ncbi:MAG: choice-of-anchor Q domain-containing protein [Planctomycetota bacterium]